ncbi:GNAT family N-acetyltransferase [Candidatus Nitrosopumilus sediminis]|uniref:N-acetyltransferase GCN5 n=1 Tax=Candidatus Nitrosopumilus sediminis TaxID=1229909 RepID=K0B818_9ARCH|nr:GNAT family N-acetyltransferase [Candidatus Nitrosopumilus sediminis]AFS82278.1 N-acetyltransferase GCN5 [Candidatus Nitrosopumilus sediminis]
MIIRNATEKDIPSILELLYELGRPEPIDKKEIIVFKNKIKDYFSDPTKLILVAEIDSEIVGLVSIIFLRRLNHAKFEMYVPELIVKKKHRFTGVGKKLIAKCISIGKEENCYRIRLESGNQRKESHKFYKGLGFEQSGLSFSKNLLGNKIEINEM